MIEWTALWPLTGAALAQGREGEAIESGRRLLAAGQQRMPDDKVPGARPGKGAGC